MPIWMQLITQHFSDPCYHNDNLSLYDMLFETMCSTEHALQHNSCLARWDTTVNPIELVIDGICFSNVTINGVFYPTWNGYRISEADIITHLQITPKQGQSAEEFIQEHFNMY